MEDDNGKQGLWKYYTYDKICYYEVSFKDDRRHGYTKRFDPKNGLLLEELNYYYGLKDGPYLKYASNGQLIKEGQYKLGSKSGHWVYYSSRTGEKKYEGPYAGNKKQGEWTYYNLRGIKSASGGFLNDLKEGEWQFYGEEGQVINTVAYLKGVEASTIAQPVSTESKQPKSKTVKIKKGTNFKPVMKKEAGSAAAD